MFELLAVRCELSFECCSVLVLVWPSLLCDVCCKLFVVPCSRLDLALVVGLFLVCCLLSFGVCCVLYVGC